MFKKIIVGALVLVMAMPVVGFARTNITQANSTADQTGWLDPTTNEYFSVRTVTVRDRFGTEMQVVYLFKNGQLLNALNAGGRGVYAGMTDGMGAAAVQSMGLVGLGLTMPGTDIQNNNSPTQLSEAGAVAAPTQLQFQGQSLSNKVTNTNLNTFKPTNVNTNLNTFKPTNINTFKPINTGSGWVPPGQQKK